MTAPLNHQAFLEGTWAGTGDSGFKLPPDDFFLANRAPPPSCGRQVAFRSFLRNSPLAALPNEVLSGIPSLFGGTNHDPTVVIDRPVEIVDDCQTI